MDGQTTRAVGQYAVLFDNKMQNRVVADILDGNNSIDYEATALAADALGVGTFALTDVRDSKDYLVRRLADGNCWMVQNLDLELADFAGKNDTNGGLTPANTDLADSGRAYWDPEESTSNKITQYGSNLASQDFSGLAKYLLGTTVDVSYQFQNYYVSDGNHFWASKCTEPGVCNLESATGNTLSEIPRSYSSMVTSDQSTDYSKATQFRYIASNWKTGLIRAQTASSNSYPSEAAISWPSFGRYGTTATATYIPSIRASASTGSADEPYEDNANGTYYGSMYIGHMYNWYAATAETGHYSAVKSSDDSICPSGWRLPQAGHESGKISMANLIKYSYGIYNYDGEQTNDNTPQGTAYGPATDVTKLPISLSESGFYHEGDGHVYNRGVFVVYWATSQSGNRADYFAFGATNMRSTAYSKERGGSVRCVSHGTENQVTPPEDVVQSTCAANSICYDANGGTGTMSNTTGATFGSSKVLSAPTYTRTGYAFVGWSESKDAVKSGAYIYGPNETITVPNLSSEGMTLYAQWLAPENSSYTMQAFGRNETVKTCANMTDGNNGTTEERIALRDERDDNVYIVTKLKDGNCWMTSNLALNLADFAGKTTGTLLTPENTDLTASREDLSTLTIEGVFS